VQAWRDPAEAVLALLYAVSGLLCLLGAAAPMNPRTPVLLLGVLGAVGLGMSGLLWLRRSTMTTVGTHAALALFTALIGLLAWRSVTALGIVGLGPVMITLGLYAGHFLGVRAARCHVAALITVSSAGAWAAAPSGFLMPWLCLVAAVGIVGEVQARLAVALRAEATIDSLTGVANRRAWERDAERQLALAARTGEPVTIALLDLDDFKAVNDRHGHAAGDALLRELTAGWTTRLRRADSLGRYGGDEFVLCLPATDEEGAAELLEQLDATHDSAWSTGTAAAREDDTLEVVLARADADLYAKKEARRIAAGSPPQRRGGA
jgi:diguanylate cyclase (GGDEF)-like protein